MTDKRRTVPITRAELDEMDKRNPERVGTLKVANEESRLVILKKTLSNLEAAQNEGDPFENTLQQRVLAPLREKWVTLLSMMPRAAAEDAFLSWLKETVQTIETDSSGIMGLVKAPAGRKKAVIYFDRKALRDFRESKGLTATKMSEDLGWKPYQISKIEKGAVLLSEQLAVQIAIQYGMDPRKLMLEPDAFDQVNEDRSVMDWVHGTTLFTRHKEDVDTVRDTFNETAKREYEEIDKSWEDDDEVVAMNRIADDALIVLTRIKDADATFRTGVQNFSEAQNHIKSGFLAFKKAVSLAEEKDMAAIGEAHNSLEERLEKLEVAENNFQFVSPNLVPEDISKKDLLLKPHVREIEEFIVNGEAFTNILEKPEIDQTILAKEVRPAESLSDDTPDRLPPLPIYGSVRAGSDSFELNRGAEAMNWSDRPYFLQGVGEAYGLYVNSDSMYPAYSEGALLFVNPVRPARRGDDVVVEIQESNGHEDGQSMPVTALIKRLVSKSSEKVVLEQFNPPKQLEFPADQIRTMHLVVGSLAAG